MICVNIRSINAKLGEFILFMQNYSSNLDVIVSLLITVDKSLLMTNVSLYHK